MKWISIIISLTVIACTGLAGKSKENKIQSSPGSFAVLELFTSEGCSSCPPADNLLPELAKLDDNIIPLSFHVDYWNRLGWTDPFSSSEFSNRQKEYGQQFRLDGVYTPQLVVNGEYELVGSNNPGAKSAIKKALTDKPVVRISIDEVKQENNKLLITCHTEGDIKKINLIAALVQKHAETNVKAGENDGRKLSHTNVVRSFTRKPADEKTNFELTIPDSLPDDNRQLIIYAQQKNNLKIVGAAVYNWQ